jgi:hypothetical protein
VFENRPELEQILRNYPHQEGCPYGVPGDRLWVRECWSCLDSHSRPGSRIAFRADTADGERVRVDAPWRPSIHMPRWASRLTLEVTGVRVERLQDISEEDALAEGMERHLWEETMHGDTHLQVLDYRALWESINGPGSWDANPWVWAVSFKLLTP